MIETSKFFQSFLLLCSAEFYCYNWRKQVLLDSIVDSRALWMEYFKWDNVFFILSLWLFSFQSSLNTPGRRVMYLFDIKHRADLQFQLKKFRLKTLQKIYNFKIVLAALNSADLKNELTVAFVCN